MTRQRGDLTARFGQSRLQARFRVSASRNRPILDLVSMQEYDITLKLLLQGQARLTMIELAGGAVEKWLNVELPKVQNQRADLLGETADGSLVHIELQSGNEAAM